jgi:predicted DNA-binding transcriptional regulator AlpA
VTGRRTRTPSTILEPRGLNREQASLYIGISVSKFDQLVLDGRMPAPKRIDTRKVWDRHALDTAFWALPDDGPDRDVNPWDAAA